MLAIALLLGAGVSNARPMRRATPPVGAQRHGRVFEDRNADGVQGGGEPGVAGATLLAVDASGAVQCEATTGADGDYALPCATGTRVVCVPPGGAHPVGVSARPADAAGATDFGVAPYVAIDLAHGAPRCVTTARLRERGGAAAADDDLDLVAAGDATGTDALAAWFNHYDRMPLFVRRPDDARTVPNAVFALAVVAGTGGNADVITGTRAAAAGNLFAWRTLRTPGNAGHLPATYTQACRTEDGGDVRALAVLADGSVLAGTATPGDAPAAHAGGGRIEQWRRDTAGTWTRVAGGPAEGAVVAAATVGRLAAIATEAGVVVLDPARLGAADAVRWREPGAAIQAVVAADVTGDGAPDLLVARATPTGGTLELWRAEPAGERAFALARTVPLPAAPTALAAGDFGGTADVDVAVGLASGGVRVFWCDDGTLPPRGGAVAGGRVAGGVTAVAGGDLDPAGGTPGDDLVIAARPATGPGTVLVLVRGPSGAPLGAAIGR